MSSAAHLKTIMATMTTLLPASTLEPDVRFPHRQYSLLFVTCCAIRDALILNYHVILCIVGCRGLYG